MFEGPVLETRRLILRVPSREDFDAFAAMNTDAETMRFIGGTLPRAASWRKFLQMPGAWLLQGYAMFSVIEKSSGRWLGQLGPWQPEGWPGTEIGWGLAREAQGQGYATEAGEAAMAWAFEYLGWDEVIHSIHPDNVASQKLALRLGATNRGPGKLPAPFENEPIEIWAQTRAQWQARRAAGA
jgi:RimJ/RimL family protein N-acetyltransferase